MKTISTAAIFSVVTIVSACSTTGLEAPEPITWKLDKQAHEANVRLFECRKAVKAGSRSDCKPEIKAAYEAERAKDYGRFRDIGNVGVMMVR